MMYILSLESGMHTSLVHTYRMRCCQLATTKIRTDKAYIWQQTMHQHARRKCHGCTVSKWTLHSNYKIRSCKKHKPLLEWLNLNTFQADSPDRLLVALLL